MYSSGSCARLFSFSFFDVFSEVGFVTSNVSMENVPFVFKGNHEAAQFDSCVTY